MRGFLILSAFLVTVLPASAGSGVSVALPVANGNADLDHLFQTLKSVSSTEEARPVEDQILTRFRQSNSASIELLMHRADDAFSAGDKSTALKLIAAVNAIEPGYAEGWHERALLQSDAGDDKGAIESLQKVVRLNPRHFAAMVRLGDLLQVYGDKGGALALFRRALAIDPQFEGLRMRVDALSRKVDGQGI